jgi:phosphatidylglycerol lysyltransferase
VKPTLAHFRQHRATLSIVGALSLAAIGLFALHRLLIEVHPRDVRLAFHALSFGSLGISLLLTVMSYICLTLYDVLALRIIGKPLPYRTAALASFIGYTLSHNLGVAILTGGSARYRIYSAAGLSTADIVRVIATASMTFWSGVIVLAGAALTLHVTPLALGSHSVSILVQRLLGSLILLATVALLIFLASGRQSLKWKKWHIALPSARQAALQILIAGIDLALASGALFVLIPGATIQAFPLFFLAYTVAIIVALVSHVPGGIGVFEAVILAVSPAIARPALLAALVAYRIIYYLLPLGIAAVLLAIHERRIWRQPLSDVLDATQSAAASVAPLVMSALAFVGGTVLLISGSLPAIPQRLHLLRDVVPLPFIEASHIAASLAGTCLLLLAPGLYRRLDGGFILTRALLIIGAIFSLLKGFDFEEAIVLLTIAGLLQWMRRAFYRHTALTADIFSPTWIAAVTAAVGLSVWIGFFSFKHVAFQSDLWWQFAWKGDASRFMRSSFAAAILLVGAVLVWLFGAAKQPACDEDRPLFADLVFETCNRTDAMLAFAGDKRFVTSPSGKAFLMYQIQGNSWIVMSDPVGVKEEWPDLLWQLRNRADAAQGRLLLYQITTETMPLAIDLGLQLVKYGEEARVELSRFTLDGPEGKSLRYAVRRAEREGARFDIVEAALVPSVFPELRSVSDAWLKAKGQSEKAFSIGQFDPTYLSNFDIAVVRQNGHVVAFANLWATKNKAELSVDLMRHSDEMPYGTMDFLFTHVMQWGKDKDYRWFTLGIAPLAGIEARRLAPIWARAGAFLYRHGDSFYGFEGLRAYKDKFSPLWEPRYIAGPMGLGLARGLFDLQTLVGGGRRSAARRVTLALVA